MIITGICAVTGVIIGWQLGHNPIFGVLLGGVPGVIRVDNTKTAIAHGARASRPDGGSLRSFGNSRSTFAGRS